MTEDLFFELIRVTIGTQESLSQQPKADEWNTLYKLAKKQSLVGICFAGLQRLRAGEGFNRISISDMLYLTWMGMAAKIQQRNQDLEEQCVALQKRLAADGFRSCILKGQGVAPLYGEHLRGLRQCGDIDIWLEGETEEIIRYVNSISLFEKINQQHIGLRVFDDIEVEVHFTPSRWSNRLRNRTLQKWFTVVRDAQMSHRQQLHNGTEIVVPTADFNLVYLLLHIYRHLFGEGIGLRQCLDYYFTLTSASLDEESLNEVKRVVSRLGLDKFASALMWVMQKVFGLNMIGVPWVPNQCDGEFLLNEIMQMGNFGHSDERYQLNKKDSHIKRFWLSSKSKLRFIRHFPSEVFWQPIDMFLRFFEIRTLQRKASRLKEIE